MKSKKYTVLFIPDSENNIRSYNFSRRTFLVTSSIVCLSFLASIFSFYYLHIKSKEYSKIIQNYDKFAMERTRILDLSRDLERIIQMDDLIRLSLGSKIDLESKPILIDSSINLYQSRTNQISYVENIPSVAPISGFVSQRSEDLALYIKQSHNGIDIVSKEGSPILASASGVVVFSGWTYEFGNMIIIYHGDDYFTHYAHNQENFKTQLDFVDRGEVIGLVGSTGLSSGPHLHFEIWHKSTPVDPFIFFPEYYPSDLTFKNE